MPLQRLTTSIALTLMMLTVPSVASAADEEGKSESASASESESSEAAPPKPIVQLTTGIVHVRPTLKVVQLDGEYVRVSAPGMVVVTCGLHRIDRLTFDVPCGGAIRYSAAEAIVKKHEPDLRERRSTPALGMGIFLMSVGALATLVTLTVATYHQSSCRSAAVDHMSRSDCSSLEWRSEFRSRS